MIGGLLEDVIPDVSDDEEQGAPAPAPQLALESTAAAGAEAPGGCRAVVVCGAGAASAFAAGAFSLRPAPWRLATVKEIERRFPPPPKPPRFFVADGAKGATAFVLLDGPVPADLAGAWAEALLQGFGSAEKVLMLDRVFRAEWRSLLGEERPQEPYVCGLWTSRWPTAAGCGGSAVSTALLPPPLPAPNAVEGLPAALLTQCEVARRPCLAAFTLQDGAHLGEGCLRGFERLRPALTELGLLPGDWQPPDYKEAIRAVVQPMSLSIYA